MKKNEIQPSDSSDEKKPTNKYLDPEYKGDPLDDKLADGPIENRGCTDCLCCIIFVAFIIAWFAIGFYGFANGDPLLLTYPFDSNGNQCGKPDSVTADFSFVYYPVPFPYENLYHRRVCVKSCPTNSNDTVLNYFSNTTQYTSNYLNFSDSHYTFSGKYQCTDYLNRFCLPGSSQTEDYAYAYSNVTSFINISKIQQWLGDVYTVWQVIFIVAGATIVISFIYMIFLRLCIGFIVWTSILLTIGFIGVLGAFFQWAAYNVYNSDTDPDTVSNLKILAYVLYAVAGVILIYILYMCNRIRLAVAIMKVGTQYMRDVWQSILVPPCCFLLIVALYVYWVLACLYLYSSGTIENSPGVSPFASVS